VTLVTLTGVTNITKRTIHKYVTIGLVIVTIGGIAFGYFKLTQAPATGAISSIDTATDTPADRKLQFSDEFDGDSLSQRKWNTCYDNYSIDYKGCSNHGNQESQWYQASQVTVTGGNLVLQSKKQQIGGTDGEGNYRSYDYISGMVSSGRYQKGTPEKWSTTYGLYEARIKVPEGKAIWPAFWLLPVSTEWPPEIDIMELLGDKPNESIATYFWKDSSGNAAKDSSQYDYGKSLTDDWHTYAVDWREGTIDWYVDGKKIKHVESKNVSSVPMQIILNLAVGGQLPGQPDATTPASATMLVDYVRVYE